VSADDLPGEPPSPERPLGGSCLPGIRPEFHLFVASRASWETLPDDGLPRYDETYSGP